MSTEPIPPGSDTPETDALSFTAKINCGDIVYLTDKSGMLTFSNHARTLERSRNATILSANGAHLVVTERRKECNALSARVEKLEALLAEARSTIDTWITSDKRSAELISLQAKVTELEAERDGALAQAVQARASRHAQEELAKTGFRKWKEQETALQATVEQLRKDKERLDTAQHEVWDIQHYASGLEWTVEIDSGTIIGRGATIREALDAGISSPRNRSAAIATERTSSLPDDSPDLEDV